MSDLQLALIAAGVAAVGGVWAYNKWQENRHRRLAEQAFKSEQPDVLLQAAPGDDTVPFEPVLPPGERLEPVLETPIAEPSIPAAAPEQPMPNSEPAAAATTLPALPAEWADEIADCVVRIDFVEPLAASALWAVQQPWAAHLTRPLNWLGFDEAAGRWHPLDAGDGGRYLVVCGALQLADRRGAVSDAELSVFLDGARQLAEQFTGVAQMPPRDEVLMHARGLDEFCAGVDLQLGVNVVDADGRPFPGTKLRGLAEAQGLALAADGRFHAVDDAGQTVFTLANLGAETFEAESLKSLATHGITLSLDVPRVAHGRAVLERMLGVARQLTQSLGGVLVDGQRNPLTPAMIEGIRSKIAELQERMAAHQIPAGSVRALRLFS
jgi:hypothetical protein